MFLHAKGRIKVFFCGLNKYTKKGETYLHTFKKECYGFLNSGAYIMQQNYDGGGCALNAQYIPLPICNTTKNCLMVISDLQIQ